MTSPQESSGASRVSWEQYAALHLEGLYPALFQPVYEIGFLAGVDSLAPVLDGTRRKSEDYELRAKAAEPALELLKRMWQAYADVQCGWQDAVAYHGHTQCDKDGREAAGRVFEESIPLLSNLTAAPTAKHFESRQHEVHYPTNESAQ